MVNIVLTGTANRVTAVPNAFIDRYLPEADGEYVKVYLLLWRYFSENKSITIPKLADLLDDTEKDILRALRYWNKKQLIQVTLNEKKEVTGIRFLPIPASENDGEREMAAAMEAESQTAASEESFSGRAAGKTASKSGRKKEESSHVPNSALIKQLAVDEEFGQLVYIVGKYLGEPLNASGSNILGYLYGELHMRTDLLEYLVETCVDAGHKSLHYIEKIALDWHEKGIRTVEDARDQAEICRKQYYQVLKAFGLSRRGPAPEEKKVMDVWFYDYGFQLDIVLEACSRTIQSLHEPNFKYAGGILADWKKKGVKTRSDIEALDTAFQKEREAGKERRKEAAAQTAKPNRFHNFDQVGYDYDAIVKELNG